MNYKKYACCVLVIALVACALAGCTYQAGITIHDGRMEWTVTEISIGTEYLLNRKEPYKLNYTDTGVDVVVHFLMKNDE